MTNSSVYLGGNFTTAGLGNLSGSGGTVYLTGTINNTGTTLVLNGSAVSPEYKLQGATINGGTLSTPNGGELTATQAGGTLSGVTVAGTLFTGQIVRTYVDIQDGLTLAAGGVVTMYGNGVLDFLGSQSLTGTGTVDFEDNLVIDGVQKGLYVPNSGDTLTIASGVLVHGITGFVGSTTGGFVTNDGTIAADGGGTITVENDTNFSGGTLTGGSWQVGGTSSLDLLGAGISTNAADILLSGAGAQFNQNTSSSPALAAFVTNAAAGSFTIEDGTNFTSASAFANAGTVTVGSSSTFSPGGTGNIYTQTGGVTNLASGTLGATGASVIIDGGSLSGPGTVMGNLTNAGEVDLGSAAGTLTVSGTYTQFTDGTLTLKVGGTAAGSQFDQVNVSGTTALSGTLDVSLSNGFAPGLGTSYAVLNFASVTGSFSTFNSPQIDGLAAFSTSFTATSLNLVAATTAPDLAVGTITIPSQGTAGQDITITYTVNNLETAAATGRWTDSVYLSSGTNLSASTLLIGRVAQSGTVTGLSSYTGTLTAALPGVIEGLYYVIVVVDSGLQLPDLNRVNNVAASATTIDVTLPAVALSPAGGPLSPVTGTLAPSQDLYYQLSLPPENAVQVTLTTNSPGGAELYEGYQYLPDSGQFDQHAFNATSSQQQILLTSPQAGTYDFLIQSDASTDVSYSLTASLLPFELTSVTPNTVANAGNVTLTLQAANFAPGSTVTLISGNTTVAASQVQFQSNSELYATLDLSNVASGVYNVQVSDSTDTTSQSQALNVVSGSAGQLAIQVLMPTAVRAGAVFTAQVVYTNEGLTNLVAPSST